MTNEQLYFILLTFKNKYCNMFILANDKVLKGEFIVKC